MFKRFKDAATGLFTTRAKADANQSTTIAVAPPKGLSAINRRILKNALEDETLQTSAVKANRIMRDAITRVLG